MEVTLNQAPAPGPASEHPTPGKGKTDSGASKSPHSPAVVVSLSLTAEELSDSDPTSGHASTIPGKSVAHQARRILGTEQFTALRDLPFGQVVSALARGIDPTSLLPESETVSTTEEGEADVLSPENPEETAESTEPLQAADATVESSTPSPPTDADIALATLTAGTGSLDKSI